MGWDGEIRREKIHGGKYNESGRNGGEWRDGKRTIVNKKNTSVNEKGWERMGKITKKKRNEC